MNTYRVVPTLNGLFWLFKPEGAPEPVTINLERLGRKIKLVNGAQRNWLAEGEYLVGPVLPPEAGEQGNVLMTFMQVLSAYRELLAEHPGHALKVVDGLAATLIDGKLACVPVAADGSLEMQSAHDFDASAFIEAEGRWDDSTAQALSESLESPVFIKSQDHG
jgi:hypothetical protein